VLCFEVWKNGKSFALAGVPESGVVSLILGWVGKGPGASARAAAADGPIPGLRLHVGGIDSSGPADDKRVEWIEGEELRIGDHIQVRWCRPIWLILLLEASRANLLLDNSATRRSFRAHSAE
jgi:hypothetical protein